MMSTAGTRPLKHQQMMLTQPVAQVGEIQHLLEAAGAETFLFPTLEIQPLTDTGSLIHMLRGDSFYDWLIVTSANAVRVLANCAAQQGIGLSQRFAGTRLAAVGPKTAQSLEALGFQDVLVPAEYRAEALAESLIQAGVSGRRCLFLRAEQVRDVLSLRLKAAGAELEDIIVYRATLPADHQTEAAQAALKQGQIDWIVFTSPACVRNFAQSFQAQELPQLLHGVQIASLGPITSQAAREVFGRCELEASSATLAALSQSLQQQALAKIVQT